MRAVPRLRREQVKQNKAVLIRQATTTTTKTQKTKKDGKKMEKKKKIRTRQY